MRSNVPLARRAASTTLLVVFAAYVIAFPVVANARQHWFSGPVHTHPTVGNLRTGRTAIVATAGTPQLFDVVISLESNPTGDDDGNTQGVDPQSAAQDKIERIIQYFADGVYESTEGAHKLRKVRIFRQSAKQNTADVVWTASGHPHAAINGITSSGLHIYMYDLFGNHDLLADEIGAGYTLAHEWGHYAYGLKDEYVIQNGDVRVVPSIMSSQWQAKSGDTRWLNFSIAHQSDPPGDFQNTKKTNQHRRYKASCWEVLAQKPSLLDRLRPLLGGEPLRVFYPTLEAVAPVGMALPQFPDIPGSARSDLDIIWMKDTLTYEIVIDRSGSMSGTKIENAKTAAKLLIDLASVGSTKIGIIAFDSTPTTVSPIIAIADDTAKTSLKTAIDGLTASGGTAIGAAAQSALDALLALNTSDDTKVVFLLSDGLSGDNALAPIPAYVTNQIPMFTFSYGSDADTGTLGQMATATKGRLFISPIALADVSQAFQTASTLASGQASVAAGGGTASPSPSEMPSITVDSTMTRLTVAVTHQGAPAAASFELEAPGGARHAPVQISASGGATLSFFDVSNPAAGTWRISMVAGAGVSFQFQASAESDGGYALEAAATAGEAIEYPEPFLLVAYLGKELPIAGANVRAVITFPSGSQHTVALADDGIAPDEVANDGHYTALVEYDQSGVYDVVIRAEAVAGASRLTASALELSAGPNGTLVPPEPDMPIHEAYQRFERLQITVDGVVADDHGNTPPMATAIVAANEEPVPGRIEVASDVDVFSFVVPSGTSTIVFRVIDLASGMSPHLRIFGADGVTVLGQGTIATNQSAGGYLAVTVPSQPGSTLFAEVRHNNGASGTGLYGITAGPGVGSDVLSGGSLPNVRGTLSVAGSFSPGGTVTYTLVLTNHGGAAQEDRPGHELIDVLPPQLALVSVNSTSGVAVAQSVTNSVAWNGTVAPNGSVTITINATISAAVLGATVTNQGIIAYDGDGLGFNWSSRGTDNPQTAAAEDPTSFVVAPVHAGQDIPTASDVALMLLAIMLGVAALVMLRR